MSAYSWREEYEEKEQLKLKEERRISEEKYRDCANFYDNLSPEEKNYYRQEIEYQCVKMLAPDDIKLYYTENYYESVLARREEAKVPLQQGEISQIIQHIEKEISFLEIGDGAVIYGPDTDDNFSSVLDKIDYKDRIIDVVSIIMTNEFCLDEKDWNNFKALEVEERNQEFKSRKNISVGHDETPISEMNIYVSIDLENRAVVQEIAHDEGEKVFITLFQAQTEKELLDKISGYKWDDFMAVDEEEVLVELGLNEKEEYSM
ncbi:hypothetical protein [Listeria farberi]|uniref:Uncharacterized protein n=1 Tax=Listeria farberi TaxID=2713500 RepID=A0A7X1DFR5_9LIST|nr:hypothetical protein [Listeria farberi]MBC2288842.1 hypothetical protein [Listeria farberi]